MSYIASSTLIAKIKPECLDALTIARNRAEDKAEPFEDILAQLYNEFGISQPVRYSRLLLASIDVESGGCENELDLGGEWTLFNGHLTIMCTTKMGEVQAATLINIVSRISDAWALFTGEDSGRVAVTLKNIHELDQTFIDDVEDEVDSLERLPEDTYDRTKLGQMASCLVALGKNMGATLDPVNFGTVSIGSPMLHEYGLSNYYPQTMSDWKHESL